MLRAMKKPTTKSAKKRAPKPKPKAGSAKVATSPVASRGFEHGNHASGAKHVRPGRALTPELDLAFALGHGGDGIEPMRLLPDLDPSKKPRWSDVSSFPHNVVVEYVRE